MAWLILLGTEAFCVYFKAHISEDSLNFDGWIALIAFIACAGGAIASLAIGTTGDPE
jgi:hypothetical protein